MFELVLQDGIVVDGSGAPRFRGDVAVERGRIAAVSRRPRVLPGRQVLDCSRLVVSPGFVDIHSHSDRTVVANPEGKSALQQGITTVLAGHCGGSAAPLNDAMKERLRARLAAWGVDDGRPPADWRSLGEFLDGVAVRGTGVNLGMLVGQGTIRDYVLGHEQRAATEPEVGRMQELVRESMAAGAFGLSAGRSYIPGRYAPAEEVAALCRTAAEYGGIYACHLFSEGARMFPALEEALTIARDTGIPLQVVHLKAWGKPSWGQAPALLARLERARGEGIDVLFDVYPYEYSQVFSLRGRLGRRLPRERAAARAALADPGLPAALAQELGPAVDDLATLGVVWCRNTREVVGLTLAEYAAGRDLDPISAALALLADNELEVKLAGLMSGDDVRLILQHSFAMVGTDAGARDGDDDPLGTVHPRAFGTCPQVLGYYVREQRALGLEEAVRKLTSAPARRAHLDRRGLLAPGYWADMVVFDPERIGDRADLDHPTAAPEGIHYVLVNGSIAVDRGRFYPLRAGRVLRL